MLGREDCEQLLASFSKVGIDPNLRLNDLQLQNYSTDADAEKVTETLESNRTFDRLFIKIRKLGAGGDDTVSTFAHKQSKLVIAVKSPLNDARYK